MGALSFICSKPLVTLHILWAFFPLFSEPCLTSSLRPSPVFFFIRNPFCSLSSSETHYVLLFLNFKMASCTSVAERECCIGTCCVPIGVFHYHFQPSLLFCSPVHLLLFSHCRPSSWAPESRLAPQGRSAVSWMDDKLASSVCGCEQGCMVASVETKMASGAAKERKSKHSLNGRML